MKIAAPIFCLLAAASATPVAAKPPAKPPVAAPADFSIRFSIDDATLPKQSGALLVKVGEPATFMIGNASYVLRIVARPEANGHAEVDYSVVTWRKSGLHHETSTIELTAGGADGRMMFQRTNLTTGIADNIEVKIALDKAK